MDMPHTDQEIPSKLDLLIQVTELNSESANAFIEANLKTQAKDFKAADHWYQKFEDASKRSITLMELHNQHYENPMEITSTVNTLLNGISMHADVLDSLNRQSHANQLRQEMLDISARYLGDKGQAEVKRGQAAALISQGRFNEALVYLTAARDWYQHHDDNIKLCRITLDMVDLLEWLGDYDRAITELNRAAKIVEKFLQDHPSTYSDVTKSIFSALGNIMSGTGDGSEAQQSAELYRIKTELDYYQGLLNKAAGKYETALQHFNKVLPEYQKLGSGPAILYQLAAIYLGQGNHTVALDVVHQIKPLFEKGGFLRPKLAALLRIESEIHLKLGKPEYAVATLKRGIDDLDQYYDPDLKWRLQTLYASAHATLGNEEQALSAYSDTIATINMLRKAPLGYRLDSLYLNDKLDTFYKAIDLACKSQRADKAAEFIELIKSRILTATLSVPIIEHTVTNELQALYKKFDELSREADRLEYQGYKESSGNKIKQQKQRVLEERANVLEQIRFSDPRWRNLTEPVKFDLQKIQQALIVNDYAAITLLFRPEKCIAVLALPDDVLADEIRIDSAILERMDSYLRNLHHQYPDERLYDASLNLAIGARHFIPESLLDMAVRKNGLIISPHSVLHLLPWAGLIYKGKRLFEYLPVGVSPNLSCIENLGATFNTQPSLSLFGPPDYSHCSQLASLLGAETEVKKLEQLYRNQNKLIGLAVIGSAATTEKLKELLTQAGATSAILHIACHSTYETYEPLNSGLLLSDAKLDVAEIAQMRVPYDEVILSACSTGWRPTKAEDIVLSGDDILGMPGAFLEAGVKSVLVSIPEADDYAAIKLMETYHTHRLKGVTPMQALQKTQLALLQDAELNPYQWIGFTVYGCQ